MGEALWALSALGLFGLYVWAAYRRAFSLPLAVQASGALVLLVGTLGFAAGSLDLARLGWSAFLVLTIAGERRELTRLVHLPGWSSVAFVLIWVAVGLSLALAALGQTPLALGLWWSGMASLASWLLRFDVAIRQWHARGWACHTALCLSVGYVWLALAAALAFMGLTVAWHLVWLGFAAAGLSGLSLVLRVVATFSDWPAGLAAAGMGHALAFVVFAAVMVRAVRRGR